MLKITINVFKSYNRLVQVSRFMNTRSRITRRIGDLAISTPYVKGAAEVMSTASFFVGILITAYSFLIFLFSVMFIVSSRFFTFFFLISKFALVNKYS